MGMRCNVLIQGPPPALPMVDVTESPHIAHTTAHAMSIPLLVWHLLEFSWFL